MPKTYLSAVVSAEGETAEGETAGQFAAKWVGSIKWVAQSPFRPTHKRKNWFVGVAVLDLAKEQTIEAKDIRYETLKASGPGGQHVNKTESAVRATHVPTGESSVSMEERSQHMNKKRSYEKLQARIASLNLLRGKTVQRGNWMNHNELERGNPIQTFKEKL